MNIRTLKYGLLKLLTALFLLPMATACGLVTDDIEETIPREADAVDYINITISVRASEAVGTRANKPQGGEEGDGREKGIDTRENEVDGVTLIFFQDPENTNAGINATAENAAATTIDYVVYYTVTRDDNHVPNGTHYPDEIYYTTGEKELAPTGLQSDKVYHLLVVANANLTVGDNKIISGVTTLAQVRDMALSSVYTGTGIGANAEKFVMTSEKDHVIDFTYSTYDEANNRRTFQLDNVHIERMAARIDFWANGSTGYNATYDHPGYEYGVGTDGDHFVLTSVTPFNLNMGTGNEYIFKRTNDATNNYLADETTGNWVIDPYTAVKTNNAHPAWMVSTLTTVEANTADDYKITMESCQSSKLSVGSYDNIIIAYPMENTLLSTSYLYYHATGIAFEGYYYPDNTITGGERRVYYHYLRHQGEGESYSALISPLSKTITCGTLDNAPAMNYGVVRNNIYRVEISSITPDDKLVLHIKVKMWDKFTHDIIYM